MSDPLSLSATKGTHHSPSSSTTADYRIRSDPNPLCEDPDIEEDIYYRITPGSQVTDDQLDTCASHFTLYYGVWSAIARYKVGFWAKHGHRIHTNREQLRRKSLPETANNIFITAMTGRGEQIGHCFVSQWKHGSDRVWWITQLLVIEGYRNQRRATKMLQALTMHYDIGRLPCQRDLVGAITVNPYTICTVLRIFGRGIDALPSRPDWEKRIIQIPHTPLKHLKCSPIVHAAPIDYMKSARVIPNTLIVNTDFFIDHIETENALRRIIYSMNKQRPEPWEWLFGILAQGCEYVCVLECRNDPEYSLQWKQRSKVNVPSGDFSQSDVMGREQPSGVLSKYSNRSGCSSTFAPYVEIDKYLFQVPTSCVLDPHQPIPAHESLNWIKRRRIVKAKILMTQYATMLPMIMDAKQIPDSLCEAYQAPHMTCPLPKYMTTWTSFKDYIYGISGNDTKCENRLLILQAMHFQDLLEAQEKARAHRVRSAVVAKMRNKAFKMPAELRFQNKILAVPKAIATNNTVTAAAAAAIGAAAASALKPSALVPRCDPWSRFALTRPSKKSGLAEHVNKNNEQAESEEPESHSSQTKPAAAAMSKMITMPVAAAATPQLTTPRPASRVTSSTAALDAASSPASSSIMDTPPQQSQRSDKKNPAPSSPSPHSSSRPNGTAAPTLSSPSQVPNRDYKNHNNNNSSKFMTTAGFSPSSSRHREKTHSPQLFFSDDESDSEVDSDNDDDHDGYYLKPDTPMRWRRGGLKNSGKILDRTRGKRVS